MNRIKEILFLTILCSSCATKQPHSDKAPTPTPTPTPIPTPTPTPAEAVPQVPPPTIQTEWKELKVSEIMGDSRLQFQWRFKVPPNATVTPVPPREKTEDEKKYPWSAITDYFTVKFGTTTLLVHSRHHDRPMTPDQALSVKNGRVRKQTLATGFIVQGKKKGQWNTAAYLSGFECGAASSVQAEADIAFRILSSFQKE